MVCQIIKDPSVPYPGSFPSSIDLNAVQDPFTQSSLYNLSKRAFSVGMPYFVFAIATLENGRYAYYDGISYRIGKHNEIQGMDKDPFTRLKINNVHYFALSKSDSLEQERDLSVHPYPNALYSSLSLLSFTKDKIERYAFTALNYHVVEKGNQEDLKTLKNIQEILKLAFELILPYDVSACNLESKKWSQIVNK